MRAVNWGSAATGVGVWAVRESSECVIAVAVAAVVSCLG